MMRLMGTLSDDDKSGLDETKQYYIGEDADLDASYFGFDPTSDAVSIISGSRNWLMAIWQVPMALSSLVPL